MLKKASTLLIVAEKNDRIVYGQTNVERGCEKLILERYLDQK